MPLLPQRDEVVLSLQGGLGNQLFQWALAQSLTAQGRQVLFDRVRCRGDRPFALDGLIPPDRVVSRFSGLALVAADKARILGSNRRYPLRRVKQQHAGFDATVRPRLGGTCYLTGYFQSPHYFTDVSETVRERARTHLTSFLTRDGAALADELAGDPASVAVHVRRGDYVDQPAAAAKHGALDATYYERAVDAAAETGHTRRVWFSDEPAWVAEHLARDSDTIVSPGMTTADGGEIALMAACRSRIIANSSFSWWGGWLGQPSTPDHPVVAPLAWFADGHSDAADLIPDIWQRL